MLSAGGIVGVPAVTGTPTLVGRQLRGLDGVEAADGGDGDRPGGSSRRT
jgi:hypothetical protein